jgi:hypothetical protein
MIYKMPKTLAQKKAQQNYIIRKMASPQAEEFAATHRGYCKAYCKRRYDNDPEYRQKMIDRAKETYLSDSTLRSIKRLFK